MEIYYILFYNQNMKDNNVTFTQMKETIKEFVKERDWNQFHSPKNLSMSISIEASELMEHFQWLTTLQSWEVGEDEEMMQEIRDELSDILCYCFNMANVLDIDISSAMETKIEKNKEKYPIDKAKGLATKYDKY